MAQLALDPSILSRPGGVIYQANRNLTGNESEGELVSKRRSLIKDKISTINVMQF